MIQDMNSELAAIVAPDCDRDVAQNYATLAERAKTRDFGLLEDDVVIVDTETTGLDFKDCELIEVAAARMRGREIVDTMDLFVRPQKPIPAEIVKITGITNEMVADAPQAAEVTERFAAFAQGAPIVAHNATFDRHFLEKGNGGRPVGEVWVDSLELSRIVLPCLTSHKLHDLSRAFQLHQSTHRALDDVIATCGLWRILLTAASDLPAGLLCALADFYPNVPWSYRPVFAQLAAERPNTPFSLNDERAARCAKTAIVARHDARALEELGPLSFPTPDEVEREFGSNSYAAIEAGTGVGKSIAYLLPAALMAQRNKITVGVATKSNALTDQLINRELPLLSSAMDKPLVYGALKGFDNYPCLRKVDRLVRFGLSKAASAPMPEQDERNVGDEGEPMPAVRGKGGTGGMPEPGEELLNALAAIASYSVQSAQGDINCLGIRWGRVQRSDFTSTAAECQKRTCPFFPGKCFLHLARRRAASCDVLVTNHSLLFRQVGSDMEVLPPIRYWIVDEAHSVEQEARRQWALKANSRETAAAFDLMGGTNSGAIGTLMREVRTKPAATLMAGLLTKTASECARASIASGQFFDDLKAFCRKQARSRKSGYETETIWVDAPTRASEGFAPVVESGTGLRDLLDKAIGTAQDAVRSMADAASGDQGLLDRLNELTSALGGLVCVRDALNVCLDGTDERYVYSASASQRSGFETYELAAERIDVGSQLADVWYPEVSSVVYSSATIAVGDTFSHFAHSVGLDLVDRGSYRDLRLDSSYDFERNMGIVVAEGLPDPSKQKEAYLEALAPLLVDVHLAMNGSVLTLFTNRSEMDRMYELVQPELARAGLELAAQSRGSNVRRLRDHFVAEPSSSLFALKSFWEGFDAQGATLRCVVIPRLPFSPPTDPLSQERRLREGKDSWRNHDLPESVLAFKQAAGRLIRSSSDTGCLVLADPRLTGMWYGRIFLASLPKRTYDKVPAARVGEHLRAWRESGAGR